MKRRDRHGMPTDDEVIDAIRSVPTHHTFLAGYDKKVTWTPTAGALATFNITEHSWEEAVEKLVTTHSGTAGIQYLLAGVLSGKGNFKANLDDAQLVSNSTISIRAGTNGVMNFYAFASGSNPWTVPCMIISVPVKSVVMGLVSYECNVELNGVAGTYARPS
jgi:hypothetical protein